METFKVAVRVRPLSEKEQGQGRIVELQEDQRVLVFDPPGAADAGRTGRTKNMRFYYDRVFDERATNAQIYEETVAPLLEKLLEGFNLTVFAYGPTGSGKTYTIQGDEKDEGVMQRLIRTLFQKTRAQKTSLSASFMEIYNEQVNDLQTGAANLQVHLPVGRPAAVAGLSESAVSTFEEFQGLLAKAVARRKTFATGENARSSRSHSIVRLRLADEARGTLATLLVCDLAGSERLKKTGAEGQRLAEGCMINRSLLSLGKCISTLASTGRSAFVSFRDSKLTMVLRDSLSGQSKVLMLANVSPAAGSYDDTLSCLTYAQKATSIKVQMKACVQAEQLSVGELQELVKRLKQENQTYQKELEEFRTSEDLDELAGLLKQAASIAETSYRNDAERKFLELTAQETHDQSGLARARQLGQLHEMERQEMERLKSAIGQFSSKRALQLVREHDLEVRRLALQYTAELRQRAADFYRAGWASARKTVEDQRRAAAELLSLAGQTDPVRTEHLRSAFDSAGDGAAAA